MVWGQALGRQGHFQGHFGQVKKVMEVNKMMKINCRNDLDGHQHVIQQDHIYNGKFPVCLSVWILLVGKNEKLESFQLEFLE